MPSSDDEPLAFGVCAGLCGGGEGGFRREARRGLCFVGINDEEIDRQSDGFPERVPRRGVQNDANAFGVGERHGLSDAF